MKRAACGVLVVVAVLLLMPVPSQAGGHGWRGHGRHGHGWHGNRWHGRHSTRIHIGLGSATAVEELEVYWPASDTSQSFTNVALDSAFEITEGDSSLRRIRLPLLDW